MTDATRIAFSGPWAEAWGDALNHSPSYRTAAATWEGTLVAAAVDADGTLMAAIYLDVWHGDCRQARAATAADLEAADFSLAAAPPAWRDLFEGRIAPVMALLTGRIQLTKGELTRLLPYGAAAKELMTIASTLETSYPAGW